MYSCNLQSPSEGKEVVANVFDKYLYKSDIALVVPDGLSDEDSAHFVKSYVEKWVRDELMLNKARFNLKQQEEADIEQKLDDYRTSLTIYAYEKELIKQQLDTAISTDDILEFYEPNKKNFRLRDNIIRMIYIKVSKPVTNITQLRKLYISDDEEDRASLSDYCLEYSNSFSLSDENWVEFDQILEKMPLEVSDHQAFLKNNVNLEIQDSLSVYFLRIVEYFLKDEISPVQYESDNIRSLILNKRKLELIKNLERSVYQDALAKGDFTIY